MAQTITLFELPNYVDCPFSASSYCAKLELYLRLTERAYEKKTGDLRKSPNKRVPYVRWPDGTEQADSGEIIERLEAEGPSLDEGLAGADRERGIKMEGVAQGILYYACLYARFVDEDGWAMQRRIIQPLLPKWLAPVLLPMIRRSQVTACRDNGFFNDEGYDTLAEGFAKIMATMGDRPFLLGDKPHVADCAVWANMAHLALTRTDNPGKRLVRENAAAMDYVRRLGGRVGWALPGLEAA